MENLGEILKQARQSKKLSIDEVHKLTKINKNYLMALESSNIKVFPAEVYYKNFLKRYAIFLGLDGSKILKEYEDSKKNNIETTEIDKHIVVEKIKNSKRSIIIPIIVCFVVILLFTINYLIKLDAQKTEKEIDNLINANNIYIEQENKNISLKSSIENSQKLDVVVETKTIQQADIIANTSSATSNKTVFEKQKLFINVKEDTWVDIIADTKRQYKGYLFSNEKRTFYAEKKFVIKIGKVSGLDVSFNGKQVDITKNAHKNGVNTVELE